MRRARPVLALAALLLAGVAGAADRPAPLAVGDHAPDFTLTDQDGRPVTLADVLARRRAVVLAFYIRADAPG